MCTGFLRSFKAQHLFLCSRVMEADETLQDGMMYGAFQTKHRTLYSSVRTRENVEAV